MSAERPTRAEITSFVRRLRSHIRLDSYRNCGAITNELRNELMEEYPSLMPERREVRIRYTPHSMAGSEHALLVIPAGQLADESQPLIIDGSLDQFCKENKDEGIVGATIPSKYGDGPAPRDEFESVEIFTRQENPEWASRMAGL